MGSSASEWVLNVAIFSGAEYLGGIALRGHQGTQAAARLRQRVPCRGASATSQLSQTAARGRNRLREATGESLLAPPNPPLRRTAGLILNHP
jgi:hypothetical protein